MDDHLKVLKEKIIIRGRVEPLTSLHIGWQRSFDPVDSDAQVIKDPRGNPFIPGSSFKGILRSFIERFLSGAGVKKVCFPTDNESCIDDEELDELVEAGDKIKYILENACPVCRVFGSSHMGSKLKIKDMPVKKEEWHEVFLRIRDGIIIDRESRTAKDKGKYDFETVSPGVVFNMELVGDNLTDAEKGMIFTAFDLISQGFGALGGNVSRGTGKIKINLTEIEILNPRQFFEQYNKDKNNIAPVIKKGVELEQYIKKMIDSFFETYRSEVEHV
ncbi:MAG: CRISPR-associated RAMP protein Csx7 [Candidatus Aminicenantes bacterium]|jgi:CRISPR-associated RAMP protein (TIGR02581 family)